MNLEVKWFIYVLVQEDMLDYSECMKLYGALSPDVELGDYAQAVLDNYTLELSDEDISAMMDEFQVIAEYAIKQAAAGLVPPQLVDEVEEKEPPVVNIKYEELPDLPNINFNNETDCRGVMNRLINYLRTIEVTELHMSAGSRPFIRYRGKIVKFGDVLAPEMAEKLNLSLLSLGRREQLRREQEINISLEIGGMRYRCNFLYHTMGLSGTYTFVPNELRSLTELGFLANSLSGIEDLLDYQSGLILVSSPHHGGKTTTINSMIDWMNNNRQDHIIMLEDPVEFVHTSKNCNISQREIFTNTKDYSTALEAALHEDPNIIVLGELNDLNIIESALQAAENGHLVIAALDCDNVVGALNYLINSFSGSEQQHLREACAGCLCGIICQKLIPGIDGSPTLVYEFMSRNMAITNIIMDNNLEQLKAAMQIGGKFGMTTMEQTLSNLFRQGKISKTAALNMIKDPDQKRQMRELLDGNDSRRSATINAINRLKK